MPSSSSSFASLFDPAHPAALIEHMVHAVNEDAELQRRGAQCDADWLLAIEQAVFHMKVRNGRIVSADPGQILMRSWSFAIRASGATWGRFWQPVPEAGWHDLFALTKRGHATIEGDFNPLLTHLQYFKDVLAMPRRFGARA